MTDFFFLQSASCLLLNLAKWLIHKLKDFNHKKIYPYHNFFFWSAKIQPLKFNDFFVTYYFCILPKNLYSFIWIYQQIFLKFRRFASSTENTSSPSRSIIFNTEERSLFTLNAYRTTTFTLKAYQKCHRYMESIDTTLPK